MIRRRLVGCTLRRYRENLGDTLSDVALILECHASKVSRIETGERGIRAKELRELLTEYGIGGEQLEIRTGPGRPQPGPGPRLAQREQVRRHQDAAVQALTRPARARHHRAGRHKRLQDREREAPGKGWHGTSLVSATRTARCTAPTRSTGASAR